MIKKIIFLFLIIGITNYLPSYYGNLEVDPELQSNAKSSIELMVAQFSAKGGTLVVLEDGTSPFQLKSGDVVFPSCSGGNNRSQTLWNVLRPYSEKIHLMPPHATSYGFDPYNGQANWLRIKEQQKNDQFHVWAGVPKSPKLGWDVFSMWLGKTATPAQLKNISDYYTSIYFHPAVPEGTRRVYITFTKNAHIHLFRLNQTNSSLKDVILVVYPLQDLVKNVLPEWNTVPGSVKTYVELSSRIKTHLDLSLLEGSDHP